MAFHRFLARLARYSVLLLILAAVLLTFVIRLLVSEPEVLAMILHAGLAAAALFCLAVVLSALCCCVFAQCRRKKMCRNS